MTGGVQASYPFRLAASRQATFPKGTAFGGGGKVSGSAIRRPLGGAGCERSEQTEGVLSRSATPSQALPKGELNSLSQNLTVLTAPSGREPLARSETLCFSRKLCRYAKGPILEGAVAEGDWGSSGKHPFRLAASRQATFPKGTAFGGGGKVSGTAQRRPLGGAGCERSEQTEGVYPLSSCIYHIFIDNKPHFAVNWEHKTGAVPEKGRKANERYSTL